MPTQITKQYPKRIPYDLSCPSAKGAIQKRLCCSCGIYFGTIKAVNKHKRCCNQAGQVVEEETRVRPTRIAARRQRELLCVMAMQELEWHAIDDVDADGLEEDVADVREEIGTPVLEELTQIWVDEAE